MNILFIGAHPDDIELGCGGSICYFLKKKHEVFCYHLTSGVYSNIYGEVVRTFEEIIAATNKSLGVLGVKKENISFTEVPATELKVNKEMISGLQKFIIDHDINMIFTHPNPDTYHQDHRAAHNIAMASARRYVNNILLFEIIFNFASGLMIPNYYINISKFIEKKQQSIRHHEIEFNKFGGEKWIDSITSLAKYRGTQAEVDYAEAFYVMKYLLD
ncbi:MAG: PIG-L family deacetylase [Candidatus Lokiarchaeota archaeon]|nr:PIG-L family deacetylase [Candidatus Lokiarchaeota archaeon]